jgi:hypothetical protein
MDLVVRVRKGFGKFPAHLADRPGIEGLIGPDRTQ